MMKANSTGRISHKENGWIWSYCIMYVGIGVAIGVISKLLLLSNQDLSNSYNIGVYVIEIILGLMVGGFVAYNLLSNNSTKKFSPIRFVLGIIIPILMIIAPLVYLFTSNSQFIVLKNIEIIVIIGGILLGSEVFREIKNRKYSI
ncbi:MAG: hypothetical protein RR313_09755 [Anaerovoracaceae bacterium]